MRVLWISLPAMAICHPGVLVPVGKGGPPGPVPQNFPPMPPPYQRGPDVITLEPLVHHDVVFMDVPQVKDYIPPPVVVAPVQQKEPVVIHGEPTNSLPGAPAMLPVKQARISQPAWKPVAIMGAQKGPAFRPVARIPGKTPPQLPAPRAHIRPVRKGEM